MHEDDLVEVATFWFRHEAEFAVSVLEAAGIDAIVKDGFFAGIRPHVPFASGGVPVLVRAGDAEEAREVLDSEARATESDEGGK